MKAAQSLKLGASAQMLPIFLGYGLNLAATPFVVANLGLTNFGLWAVTGAVAQYGVLLDLGVSRGIMRYVALYHSRGQEAEERAVIGGSVTVIVAMGCLLMCFPLLIPNQLAHLIGANDANLSRILFGSSIIVLITGIIGQIFAAASIARGRMVAPNIGLSLQRSAVVMGGVIAIIVKPTLGHFAAGSAIGGIVGLAMALLAILFDEHEIRIGRPRVSVLPDVMAFGLKGQVLTVCDLVMFQSGKLLAGIIVGPAAAGAYELGSRLAFGARAFGTSASGALSAHLTRAYALKGSAEIRREYARLVKRNTAVSIFAPLFCTATAFSAVPAWLGVNHPDTVWVVVVLSIAYAINVSTGVTTAAAYALNQLGKVTVAVIAGTCLTFVLALGLAFLAGLLGILIGIAIAIVFTAILAVVLVHRSSGIPMSDFISPATGPMLVGIFSTVLAAPVGIIVHPMDRASAVGPFVASTCIFCAVYMALGWQLGYLPTLKGFNTRRMRQTEAPATDD